MEERRHQYMWKDFVIPIVVASFIGITSSYLSSRLTMAVLEVQLMNVIETTTERFSRIEEMQAQIAKNVSDIQTTRYKPDDADRDRELILLEIKNYQLRINTEMERIDDDFERLNTRLQQVLNKLQSP